MLIILECSKFSTLISGFGASLLLIASIGIVPHYFERRKSAAYAGPAMGSGIGMVSYPYISSAMLETFGYRFGGLYLAPLFMMTLSAPLVYRPQLVPDKRKTIKSIATDYLSLFKCYVTPFYLLNAYFWNAGHISIMVILFSYVSDKSQTSVAILSFSLIGAGFLTGTFLCMAYLSKFTLNHLMLQVTANFTLGVCSIIYAFVDHHIAYYVTSMIIGIAHGSTIANMASVCSHLFPVKNVAGAFAFQEAVGGIAGFIGPVTTGMIQSSYSGSAGLCYIAANGFLAVVILVLAGLIRPTLWTPYVNVPESSDVESTEGNHKVDKHELSSIEDKGYYNSIESVQSIPVRISQTV